MMNKSAKIGIGWKVAGGVFLGVLAVILLFSILPEKQVVTPGLGGCADSTGPLTVNAVSALAQGSAVSTPTITAGVNGGPVTTSVTSGTTTFPIDANVNVLVSKSDYIDEAYNFVMPCGGKILPAPLYYSTSDNPAVRIKNDDGDYVTDAVIGGATNQTAVSAGETFVMEVEFTGTNLESSGDGIYVIEFAAGTGTNISKVELGSLRQVPIPSVHTLQVAGGEAIAFEVPAVVSSGRMTYPLTVTLASTKLVSAGVYTDWYSKL